MVAIIRDATTITPSDVTEINFEGLFVGTAGHVKVTTWGGTDVVFYNIGAGEFLPIAVTKVHSTTTSASNILGLNFFVR